MKEQALVIARQRPNKRDGINALREYLQHVLLRELFELNLLEALVFHGGTALRILYGLRRFSEDIDFHVRGKDTHFDLGSVVGRLVTRLQNQNYSVSVKNKTKGAVHSGMIKFEGILQEVNLSLHPEEKLSIRFEVDTNPPEGFNVDFMLVNLYMPYGVIHHDKPTFLSGKLHAILQRPYMKGRDLFDLWFFLSRWKDVLPNFLYLNNALKQTGYRGAEIVEQNWIHVVCEHVNPVDWEQVVQDVEPFIAHEKDLELFKKDTLLSLLRKTA
jgi:predicted nucleotidyltransferase component of viral defense system